MALHPKPGILTAISKSLSLQLMAVWSSGQGIARFISRRCTHCTSYNWGGVALNPKPHANPKL